MNFRLSPESSPQQSLDSSPGAILSVRDKIRRQLEYGHKKGATIANENGEVIVKLRVDAAKLTYYESICVYSLESIFSGS